MKGFQYPQKARCQSLHMSRTFPFIVVGFCKISHSNHFVQDIGGGPILNLRRWLDLLQHALGLPLFLVLMGGFAYDFAAGLQGMRRLKALCENMESPPASKANNMDYRNVST